MSTTLIRNASVYTGTAGRPWAEAVAIAGDSIVAAGSEEHCRNLGGRPDNIIDAEGRLVLPAFNDSHTHFLLGSQSLLEVDLRTVDSKDAFRQAVREAVGRLEEGQWLTGGYWNNEYWPGGQLPDRSWIEDITAGHPAILYRHDLHSCLCNTAALQAAGFSQDSSDPPGGTLSRSSSGSLSGMVYEKAMTMVRQCIPPASQPQIDEALAAGIRHANSLGITAATDMIDSVDVIDHYQRYCGDDHPGMRFELCPPLPQRSQVFERGIKPWQSWGVVRTGPLKGFMDGSLGSRTAYMRNAYADDAENRGYLLDMANPPEKMLGMIEESAREGFSSTVHAIGTEAVHILLNLFQRAAQAETHKPVPFRVEHAQHILDEDLQRFARLDLVASMQPAHLIDDGNYVETALGKDLEHTAYRCKSLIHSGALVTFNTDWPVVELNPMTGIWAAVTRRTSDGRNQNGWLPQEKVTVQEAVRAYTAAPARAALEDSRHGQLAPGFQADLVMLDTNIFLSDPDAIREARALMTMAAGRIVYEA